MNIDQDEGRGQKVGSRIRIAGSVLGINLAVDETVIERDPPRRKVWETIGVPRLLVIGHYRMGFEVTPTDDAARLRVFIDYSLPARLLRVGWGFSSPAITPSGVRKAWSTTLRSRSPTLESIDRRHPSVRAANFYSYVGKIPHASV